MTDVPAPVGLGMWLQERHEKLIESRAACHRSLDSANRSIGEMRNKIQGLEVALSEYKTMSFWRRLRFLFTKPMKKEEHDLCWD